MAESRLIPTITILEGVTPDIDIITFYAELLGVPNILRAFIAPASGEVSNGTIFSYGEGGITMKNWPDFIDVSLEDGQLKIITPDIIDAPADALNYFINTEGYLHYYFPDIPFHPSDFTEFEWGLDFGNISDLSLDVGNEINNATHMQGSSQAGTWSAVGSKRPILLDGSAVFDGADDELLASFLETSSSGELFIVGKSIQEDNFFLTQGTSTIPDGDLIGFGTLNNHLSSKQTTALQLNYEGVFEIEQEEFQLFHYESGTKHRYNGFLDNNNINPRWFSNSVGDNLKIGYEVRSIPSTNYYPISIKEILYFSNLTDEKRECIETYLKYKHDIPVFVNPFHIS